MYTEFVHKNDLEKMLQTMKVTLFALEDDIERPVVGVDEVEQFEPGTLDLDTAIRIVEEHYKTLPPDETCIYYSAMLGFWDYSKNPKYLVHAIDMDFDGLVMYDDSYISENVIGSTRYIV